MRRLTGSLLLLAFFLTPLVQAGQSKKMKKINYKKYYVVKPYNNHKKSKKAVMQVLPHNQ